LLNALRRGYIKLSDIALIVFDECHHARYNHSYRLIIKEFYDDEAVVKRIKNSRDVRFLGLTASPMLRFQMKRILNQRKYILPVDIISE
jgi:endoribonuclease Dicer